LIERGARLTNVLVQGRFSPINVFKQILILFFALNGFFDMIKAI
jgi:F0F1-type ATP synthase alpha subunit